MRRTHVKKLKCNKHAFPIQRDVAFEWGNMIQWSIIRKHVSLNSINILNT